MLYKFSQIIFCTLIIGSTYSVAQTISRQSVGTIGKSFSNNEMTVQQSIGQSYGTSSRHQNTVHVHPGFIQRQQLFLVEENTLTDLPIELLIYPNPSAAFVQFSAEEPSENVDETIQIEVFSIDGVRIFSNQIPNLSSYILDCSSWSSGSYIIHISRNNRQLYYAKLIKQDQ